MKLNGNKTYLVALGGVLGALSGWLTGAMDPTEAARLAFEAVLAATIRHGISTATTPKS